MKYYKIISTLILFFFLIGICVADSNLNSLDLIGKVIYLDPGHGGIDPGAVYKNISESDINLAFAFELKDELERNGAVVLLTRDGDYDLSSSSFNHKKSDISNRIAIISESNADMYISIHMNAEESGIWYGSQVFYDDVNKNNIVLAKSIQEELNKKREIYERDNIKLCRSVTIPGVLVEIGFITNYRDRKKMQTEKHRKEISKLITNGIIKYYN